MHTIGARSSLNLELPCCIYANFRLSFLQLDSASDFDVLSFDTEQHGRFRDRGSGRNPAGKCLVRVGGADIEKRVAAFRREDLRHHSLDGRVFADVTGRKISWNDGRGLSAGYVKQDGVRNNKERNATRETDHGFLPN
jgi:hypothetical protein